MTIIIHGKTGFCAKFDFFSGDISLIRAYSGQPQKFNIRIELHLKQDGSYALLLSLATQYL